LPNTRERELLSSPEINVPGGDTVQHVCADPMGVERIPESDLRTDFSLKKRFVSCSTFLDEC
jgi:hypothetical protein